MQRRPVAVGASSPVDRLRDAPSAARTFAIAVDALAIAGFAVALAAIGVDPIVAMFGRPTLYLVTALIVIADMYPLVPWMRDVRGRVRLHFSGTFALALVLVCGPPAVVLFPLIALGAQSTMRTATWRRCFNTAVLTLEALLGFLAIHLVFGSWPETPSVAVLLAGGVVAGLTWEVVNVLSVCTAMTLVNGTPFAQALRLGAGRTAPWLGALVATPIIAYVALQAPLLVPSIGLLTILIHGTVASTIRSSDDARIDQLTGLANRTAALEELDNRLHPSRRGTGAVLLMIDLDGFKSVNDTYGHEAGDRVLVDIGRRLRTTLAADLLVARLGGDEFVVIGDATLDADPIEQAVRRAVRAPIRLSASASAIELDCSIGAVAAGADMEPLDVLRTADWRMYQAKTARPAPGGAVPEAVPPNA